MAGRSLLKQSDEKLLALVPLIAAKLEELRGAFGKDAASREALEIAIEKLKTLSPEPL